MTTMFWFGRFVPGLSVAIAGSFQDFILPRKMSARTEPVSLSPLFGSSGMLYAATIEPIVSGICTTGPVMFDLCDALNGASEAPKSTVLPVSYFIPAPLPMA